MKRKKVFIVRIYNVKIEKYGDLIFLCDKHFKKLQDNLNKNQFCGFAKKIGVSTTYGCEECR